MRGSTKVAAAIPAAAAAIISMTHPDPASAACSTPSGIEGEMRYFSGDQAYKYCDGADWSPMGGSMPAGAIAHFEGSSCPAGWAEYTPARGRTIVGLPSGGTAGGTVNGAYSDLENREHTHMSPHFTAGGTGSAGIRVLNDDATLPWGTTNGPAEEAYGTNVYNGSTVGTHSNYINVSHTSATPPYIQLISCEKQLDVDAVAGSSIDGLADVDTTSDAPTLGSGLVWDGSNWVPSSTNGTPEMHVDGGIRMDTYGSGVPGSVDGLKSEGNLILTAGFDQTGNEHIFLVTNKGGSTFEPAITIRNDGDVGVGTESPTAPLHVGGLSGAAGQADLLALDEIRSGYTGGWIGGASFRFNGAMESWIGVYGNASSGSPTSRQLRITNNPADDTQPHADAQITIEDDGDVMLGSPNNTLLNPRMNGNDVYVDGWMNSRNAWVEGTIIVENSGGRSMLRLMDDGDYESRISWFESGNREFWIGWNEQGNKLDFSEDLGASATDVAYLTYQGNMWLRGSLTQNSDRRLKRDVEPIPGASAKLADLEGVYYRWNEAAGEDAPEGRRVGVVAQDVREVFPEAVSENEDGTLAVSYPELVAPAIQAINEQRAEIDSLKDRLRAQQTQIEKLKEAVSSR